VQTSIVAAFPQADFKVGIAWIKIHHWFHQPSPDQADPAHLRIGDALARVLHMTMMKMLTTREA
jgi:hypothetical protein